MAFVPEKCRIPELIRERKMQAQELSLALGISKSQLSDYANMRKVMSIQTAKTIAEYFMVPIDDLYVWKETPSRNRDR